MIASKLFVRTLPTRLLGCFALLVVMLAQGAGDAHAGTYVMRACNVPGTSSAPATVWRIQPGLTSNTYANDECATGGGFGLNAGPMPRATSSAIVLVAPTEGPQAGITIRRMRLWLISRLTGSGSAMFVTASSGGVSGEQIEDIFGPPGGSTLTAPWVSPPLLPDTKLFHVVLSCSGGTGDGCYPASPNPLEIRGAEATLNEDNAPNASLDGGTLIGDGARAGMQSLGYTASDSDSGVAKVSALIDGNVVAVHDFAAECPHNDFAACPRVRRGSMMIDTHDVVDGSHRLAVQVVDAAGNQEHVLYASPIAVANGVAGPKPNGNGGTEDAVLRAAFKGRRGTSATVDYSRAADVTGSLRSKQGHAIKGATIEISEKSVLGRHLIRRVTKTRADGTFKYDVRARGVSRRIIVRYRFDLAEVRVSASVRLTLRVRATGTVRVSLHGTQVSYDGRVLTTPLPDRGKLIYMEGRAVGGAWTRFASKRTTRSGRFTGRYRLRVHRPGVRLQFRVRIPSEKGYPFAAGSGRPVTRVVR